MTTYFVSPSGSDANNGLGPDASHATNKPWLTVGKTLNTGSTVVPGDTVYIAPGYYYSEALIPIVGVASAASPTALRGDPLNVQGFKDGSGVRLAAGLPWVTTRTAAEGIDGVIASGNHLINGTTGGTQGLQFSNLVLESAVSRAPFFLSAATNTDWLIERCRLIGTNGVNLTTGTAVAGLNLTVRQCVAITGAGLIGAILIGAPATADINMNVLVESNLVFGPLTGTMALSASGGNLAGGWAFKGCTVLAGEAANVIGTTAGRISTVTPLTIEGCLSFAIRTVFAGTAGHVIDSGYNRRFGSAADTNFTPAATSKNGVAMNLVLPDLFTWGLEMPRRDFLGWADAALAAQKNSAWAPTTPGLLGRTPRPWGAGASIGCWETPDLAQDATSALTGGGVNSLKITGQGELSLYHAVAASAQTMTCRTKSTTYGGVSYPQLIVVANPALGIPTDVSVTATDDTEQDLTTASFTPSAAGVVEVRLISRSSTVTSSTYFDTVKSV